MNLKKMVTIFVVSGFLLTFAPFVSHAQKFSPIELIGEDVSIEVESQGLAFSAALENRGFVFPLVVLAGLIDGTNVCGIALMILMVGYLAVHVKNRKRSMKIGFIFLLTIFTSYFLIGIALSSFVQSLFGWEYYETFRQALNYTIIGLLSLAGILNVQDFFFSHKFVFHVSSNNRKKFRKYLERVDVPGTIGLGILAVLFLIPCSLPLYLGSIGVLSQTFQLGQVIFYVFIYSMMFVLPLLILLSIILRAERVVSKKEIKSERFKWLKLIKGLVQIGAAYGIFLLL